MSQYPEDVCCYPSLDMFWYFSTCSNKHDLHNRLHFLFEFRRNFFCPNFNQFNNLQYHVSHDTHVNFKHRRMYTRRYKWSPEVIPTSDFGSLYLGMPAKLDPIWATQMMPWLFLLSSFFVGPCVAIVEYIWTNSRYNMKVDTEMLYGLSKISVVLMAVYFVMKGADLLMRGQLGNVFSTAASLGKP